MAAPPRRPTGTIEQAERAFKALTAKPVENASPRTNAVPAGKETVSLRLDRDVLALTPRAAASALDACRDARQAIAEFNPNETLLVERLFLHLPRG